MSLIQHWLRDKAAPYSSADRVYTDIDAALSRFVALRPKLDVYTFDDGRSHLLLCVHGLLPISYRNASYNIPIAVWITREYPRHPPIAYVVPSTDLVVKASRAVDVSGRCNLEYMQQWERKSEGCSLSALLDAMQDLFSREPPLYAKPRAAPSLSPPPALPPKPSSVPVSPPPLPPHLPSPNILTLAPPVPPPPPPPPPPLPVAQPALQPPRSPPRPTLSSAPAPNLLDEDAPDASLPGAPPAPPRPPNPETLRLHSQVHAKLTSEFNSLAQAMTLDAEKLRAHQTDLLAGEPAIRDEMARLEAVRAVCRSVADKTRRAVNLAESNVAELRRKGEPEVDELVCATSIVHDQLINLVAEDNAIEDTIYHLHRALNSGRIDLDKFLRATRALAEEQFTKRALIYKIQIGLGAVTSSS
ncbi:hypothetical protein Agabi119p4_3102 [Agaricus bisporus var. burnettii]|uniref:UEV domain-containing protein n=1 Tax=Agaricus bisporus var. burnettii TaxID=192524 RepID=A0A8H7F6G2_AGABI|nr:hypothetical protein Agabi119p4_3102 [Agaricus bisporus var. burnettii]